MIASLIENFNNVLKQYGENDILVSTMFKQAELHGLSLAELKKFGETIRKERAVLKMVTGQRCYLPSQKNVPGKLLTVGNKFMNSRTTFRI